LRTNLESAISSIRTAVLATGFGAPLLLTPLAQPVQDAALLKRRGELPLALADRLVRRLAHAARGFQPSVSPLDQEAQVLHLPRGARAVGRGHLADTRRAQRVQRVQRADRRVRLVPRFGEPRGRGLLHLLAHLEDALEPEPEHAHARLLAVCSISPARPPSSARVSDMGVEVVRVLPEEAEHGFAARHGGIHHRIAAPSGTRRPGSGPPFHGTRASIL
jgi:hypothetical protein